MSLPVSLMFSRYVSCIILVSCHLRLLLVGPGVLSVRAGGGGGGMGGASKRRGELKFVFKEVSKLKKAAKNIFSRLQLNLRNTLDLRRQLEPLQAPL